MITPRLSFACLASIPSLLSSCFAQEPASSEKAEKEQKEVELVLPSVEPLSKQQLAHAYAGGWGSMFLGYKALLRLYYLLTLEKAGALKEHPGAPLVINAVDGAILRSGIASAPSLLTLNFDRGAAGLKFASEDGGGIRCLPWSPAEVVSVGDLCHRLLVTEALVIRDGKKLATATLGPEGAWIYLGKCRESAFVPRVATLAVARVVYDEWKDKLPNDPADWIRESEKARMLEFLANFKDMDAAMRRIDPAYSEASTAAGRAFIDSVREGKLPWSLDRGFVVTPPGDGSARPLDVVVPKAVGDPVRGSTKDTDSASFPLDSLKGLFGRDAGFRFIPDVPIKRERNEK